MALPPTSTQTLSLELKRDQINRTSDNLNELKVIYDNKAFEAEMNNDSQQRHLHEDTTRTAADESGVIRVSAISTATLAANGVGPTVPTINSSTVVGGPVPPVADKRQVKLHKRVSVVEGENKRESTSDQMDISRQSKTNLPRRESGVFLLSAPGEVNISQGSLRNGQLNSHPVSRSSSGTSEVSLRSASKGSLRSDMLISPEEIWLEALESKLIMVTGGTQIVTLAKFKDALQAKKSFFVDRCFQIFDNNGSGEISLRFLIGELRSLVYGSQTDKIRFLFNIYNIGGTGKIDASEIYQVLKSCIEESKLHFTTDDLKALTEAFVSAVGKTKDGSISFDDFKELVDKHPAVAENVAVSTLLSSTQTGFDYDWMEFSQNTPVRKQSFCRYLSKAYIQNNMQKIVFLLIFMIINTGLGALNGWRYWHLNVWLITARVCGLGLNFNCTFVVVLMLRRLITYLRATPLVKVLPLDQYIMFHKICGYMIAVQSLVHTVAHVGNAFIVAQVQQLSVLEVVFTNKANIGWIYGTAPVTGVALSAVLVVMLILSMPFVRSRGCFEVFYWSHKLYLVMFALLIVHARDFWKWFLVPGVVFMLEAMSRITWIRSAYMGRTYIESVCLLPSGVTQLVITKPVGFTFKPGDFVYIQIPAIAKYEWHPFTISSAPEQRDTIWLHIRTAGYWTKSLLDYFSRYEYEDVENGTDSSGTYEVLKKCNLKRRASSIAWAKQKPLKARRIETNMRERVITKRAKVLCHIDGPYGTASRHIFRSEHAVLVGSGIGITPFASILQSIVNQFKAACVTCAKCQYTWCHTLPATVMNFRKVDFIWINRDQLHFEWFVSLLTRLEREQEIDGGLGHILDMHMYMTSALPKTDMKGLILQLALDIIHETERTDLITGLQTRTQTGRPDFDVLFQRIQANAKGHVTVFFCGSPVLGNTVKHYTHKYGFTFRHENF